MKYVLIKNGHSIFGDCTLLVPKLMLSLKITAIASSQKYLKSIILVILVSLSGYPFREFIEPTNLVMLYLMAVVVSALRYGLKPAILTSCLGVVAFNLIFIPPYYTYVVNDVQYILTFLGLLLVGILVSALVAKSNEQTQKAQQRASQMEALYNFSRDLSGTISLQQIGEILQSHASKLYGSQSFLWLTQNDSLVPYSKGQPLFSEIEQDALQFTLKNKCITGGGHSPFPDIKSIYIPLIASQTVVGILQLTLHTLPIEKTQFPFLESIANQSAQAIERVQLASKAQEAKLFKERDKLQRALLNSISHDLRTPLVSITGSLSSLREDAGQLNEQAYEILINTAWEQANRLNRYVSNLLDMTRLESGTIHLKYEMCDIQDMIGVALNQMEKQMDSRQIKTNIPFDVPLVPMDFVLMVQVMINLLDNALKYSPLHTPITIQAQAKREQVEIEVIDLGIGIPKEEISKVFNKFYRIPRADGVSGTGLGLSICKGIIEAHQGQIEIQTSEIEGTRIKIILPLKEPEWRTS